MSGRPSGSGRSSATPAGSRPGSRADSQVGSPARIPSKQTGFAKGTGVDPARDRPQLTPAQLLGRRVDLPADAYKVDGTKATRFAARPGFNTDGKGIKVQLNLFPVTSWKDKEIYQYDIIVSPNPRDSNALVKKVWNTKTVTEELAKKGGMWLYDGSKLAWSSEKIDRNEARFTVDLDSLKEKAEHEDIAKKVGKTSVYSLTIRQTTTIHLSYLRTYLEGKISWDTHVLECMNFFDHCLRQFPSEQWVTIKRNFYDPMFPVGGLSGDLVVNQGIYCAPRLSESINRGGTGLAINVDRCQTAFWPVDSIDQLAIRLLNGHKDDWSTWDEHKMAYNLRPKEEVDKKTGLVKIVPSEAFSFLRRLAKLKFTVNHRGKIGRPKIYTIKNITFDPKFGTDGANSHRMTFTKVGENGETKTVTVYDHYMDRWGIRLRWSKLPLIESTNGNLFPWELCNSVKDQRYTFKLNPQQTSDMIKAAATRPTKRREDIFEGITHLKWSEDPYLKAFGIQISPAMAVTDARLLPNPEVAFANQKINPGVSGRWDLRGKKFLEPNRVHLQSWAVVCCGEKTIRPEEVENFARLFSQTYRGHGGIIVRPAKCMTIGFGDGDYSKICEQAYNDLQRANPGVEPQMIFFILPTKNQLVYERVKKNMDCRYNLVSQCVQAGHARKAQGQYLSNVAMKVNSKLGGVTCKVPNVSKPANPPFWTKPTMMIGVDVSHAAPGSSQPSMAALTMSMDKHATRFAAACQTNGWRTETIVPEVMEEMIIKLAKNWVRMNNTSPQHIYYLRDGVSEGQFQDILTKEVDVMRRVFQNLNYGTPRFTVIIATKRHHVRFFPKPNDKITGDRNGNPLPGTLVEKDVTHPQHFDFYLCSHVAIQGTARPVHYQVILDEAGVKPNELMRMIYQQCYQYCRSTTPVSLHPAVYYAHLASNRARSHEAVPADKMVMAYGKSGFPYAKSDAEIYDDQKAEVAPPKLLTMANTRWKIDRITFMNTTMWYV
ncbi:Piwi-domain-containing protein [Daldinia caldariorum]|uniref:Piwi-domain-containing protein n=1 Tax=Daldinia caldariorum TaxID=326644 RepID=UPI002007BFB0|nr:Piwi-domain-containing protein [Daldinia caldariorum]KAI1468209.1 Piwi-domain-containing protein [Daldinia caldariorum]